MIEIELFYKIVESEIRRKHIKHLKRCKRLTSDDPAEADNLSGEPEKLESTDRLKFVKSYNKGIETALKVLIAEYAKYDVRLKKDETGKKKF